MNEYLKLFLFSLFTALILLVLQAFVLEDIHNAWPFMVIFYFLQSAILLFVLKLIVSGNHQNFVFFVIGSISFRLLTSLIAAIAYLLLIGHQKTGFIILFFALYLLFLGFELFALMSNLRSNFEKRPN